MLWQLDPPPQIATLKNSLIDLSLINRQDVMSSILHCADISGPGKTWDIHEMWTLSLMQEFFAQVNQLLCKVIIYVRITLESLAVNVVGQSYNSVRVEPKITKIIQSSRNTNRFWILNRNVRPDLKNDIWLQGDRERELELPISPLCDRHSTNIPESQVGFITYITTPAFAALGNTLDAILREKHEQEFLEASTPWVKNRRSSAVTQMTPIEESPAYHPLVNRTASKLVPNISSGENVANDSSYLYKPIERVWEKNFQDNLNRWKDRLKKKSDWFRAFACCNIVFCINIGIDNWKKF